MTELLQRVLEVRVDPKDKKILDAREREKENLGKPPQCIKQITKAGDPKMRNKQHTDSVFGMYKPHFPIQLSYVQVYQQLYFVLSSSDNHFV